MFGQGKNLSQYEHRENRFRWNHCLSPRRRGTRTRALARPPAPRVGSSGLNALLNFGFTPSSHTIEPYIRHPRLPDLSNTRVGCAIRSTSARPPKKSSVFLNRSAFRGSESFTGTTLRAFNTRFTRKSASVDRLRLPTIATQLKSSFQKKNGEGLSAFSVFATSRIERSSCELRKEVRKRAASRAT